MVYFMRHPPPPSCRVRPSFPRACMCSWALLSSLSSFDPVFQVLGPGGRLVHSLRGAADSCVEGISQVTYFILGLHVDLVSQLSLGQMLRTVLERLGLGLETTPTRTAANTATSSIGRRRCRPALRVLLTASCGVGLRQREICVQHAKTCWLAECAWHSASEQPG